MKHKNNFDLVKEPILLLCIVMITFSMVFATTKREYNPICPTYYGPSGKINTPDKVWDGIITVTTGTGQSVDYSNAGFSSIRSVTITPANNTTTTTSMPITSIKTYSTTACTFNTLVSNSGAVGLLIALITPGIFSGMQVHVHVEGN